MGYEILLTLVATVVSFTFMILIITVGADVVTTRTRNCLLKKEIFEIEKYNHALNRILMDKNSEYHGQSQVLSDLIIMYMPTNKEMQEYKSKG